MMTAQIKIHVLHTGLVKVDRVLPFHGLYRNPLAFTGLFRSEKNQVTLPVSSYLIEHPKGLVLIDTGWNKQVRTSNWKELGPQVQINTGYLPTGWAVDECLAALGYRPEDLDYVLLSHLHCDHVSGLKHVAAAKHILVSAPEWQIANRLPLVYLPHEWHGVDVQTYQYTNTGRKTCCNRNYPRAIEYPATRSPVTHLASCIPCGYTKVNRARLIRSNS